MSFSSRVIGCAVVVALYSTGPALAWGDVGHSVVATMAAKILKAESPATLSKIEAMLASDTDTLITDHDIGNQARWADSFRESSPEARELSAEWHYVDSDFDTPDMKVACFNHPKLKPKELASEGPSPACVVDKIQQFTAEIAKAGLPVEERLLALKFLLHFVGDIHQPLHAITRRDPDTNRKDRGGNCVATLTATSTKPVRLHSYWDTGLVRMALPSSTDDAIMTLMSLVTTANKASWEKGGPREWAEESYAIAKSNVYAGIVDQVPIDTDFVFPKNPFTGKPDSCGAIKLYKIDTTYDDQAMPIVRQQLAKAAVRLAWLLRENLK